jgi:hypothetical protein
MDPDRRSHDEGIRSQTGCTCPEADPGVSIPRPGYARKTAEAFGDGLTASRWTIRGEESYALPYRRTIPPRGISIVRSSSTQRDPLKCTVQENDRRCVTPSIPASSTKESTR